MRKKNVIREQQWRPTLDCVPHRCTQTFTKCFPRGMYKITPSPWRCKWADPSHPCQRFSVFFSLKKQKQKPLLILSLCLHVLSMKNQEKRTQDMIKYMF